MNCHACGERLEGVTVACTFSGFTWTSKFEGRTLTIHAKCFRFAFPDRGVVLPERISDPVAEPRIVEVYLGALGEWWAYCREHGRVVALKEVREDAEVAAAIHLSRRHAA